MAGTGVETGDYWSGEADPLAVRAYLDFQQTPLEMAQLAAALCPRLETFDPQEAAERSLSLLLAVEQALLRRREEMLGRMNYQTLLELAGELRVSQNPHPRDARDAACFADPVRGPLARRLLEQNTLSSRTADEKSRGIIDQALATADARTTLSRPPDGGGLEQALRYALDESLLPWADLWQIFTDFHTVLKEEKILNPSRVRKIRRPPDPQSEKEEREKEIAEQLYRTTFQPGVRAPESIRKQVDRKLAEHWPMDREVDHSTLAWLATDFHAFWVQHREGYRQLFGERDAAIRSRAATNRRVVAGREHTRWLERTRRFPGWLAGHGGLPAPDRRREVAAAFAASILKDGEAVKRATGFYSTLLALLHRTVPAGEAGQLLQAEGLGMVEAATLEACRTLVAETFPSTASASSAGVTRSRRPGKKS